jgi:hypothetical protein
MKRIIIAFALALLLAGCVLPWGGTKDELEMVPKSANAVAIIRPSAMLNDSDFVSFYTSNKEMTSEMERVETTTGVDPAKIERIVLFFKFDSFTEMTENYGGFVAKGTIDKDKVLEKMKVNNYVTQISYGNHVMYEISSKETPDNKSYFFFPSDGILIGGTRNAVEDSIDLNNGKAENVKIRQKLSQTYDMLDKKSMLMLLMETSESMKGEISKSQEKSFNIKALSHMDCLGFSLAKEGKNVNLTLITLADDATGANGISKLFDKSLLAVKGVAPSGSAMESILEKMKFEVNGDKVTANLPSTFNELTEFYDELSAMSSQS